MSEPTSKRMWLGEAEFEALQGLPALQFQLYIKLRWYMDGRTRRVGQVRGISYQSLAEELFVEPIRGRKRADAGSPSIQAVRSALAGLENAGLVQPCGNGEVLVFLLPKSACFSARSNDQQQVSNRGQQQVSNSPQSRMDTGVSGSYPQHEQQGVNADQQHTSRIKENTYTETTSSHAEPVDAREQDPMLLLSAVQMADWLRQAEAGRGRFAARMVPSAHEIQDWQARGLRFAQLREAYDLAVANREATQNQAALNPGFLRIFVDQVFSRPGVCRVGRTGPARGAWHATPEGIKQKAAALGLEPQRADEDDASFLSRVSWAASPPRVGGVKPYPLKPRKGA